MIERCPCGDAQCASHSVAGGRSCVARRAARARRVASVDAVWTCSARARRQQAARVRHPAARREGRHAPFPEGCRRGCTNQTRVGRRYKSKGIKLGNKTPLPGRSFRSHALPQAGIQSSAHTRCLSFVRPDSIDLSALRPRLSPSLSSPSLPTPRPRLPTSAVSTSPQAHSVRYPSLSLLPVAATRVSRRPLLHRA